MSMTKTSGTMNRSKSILLLLSCLLASCATMSPKRPPCTWELWAVDGALVNGDDGRRLPCTGAGRVECVGMTKADFMNLLYCGGRPPLKPAPTPATSKGPTP
jgi:hypothetical protein